MRLFAKGLCKNQKVLALVQNESGNLCFFRRFLGVRMVNMTDL